MQRTISIERKAKVRQKHNLFMRSQTHTY